MGLCAGESTKKSKPYKTIIIPKGVIDPNENNVIEIPLSLDTNSRLIVKASNDPQSCLTVEALSRSYQHNLPILEGQSQNHACTAGSSNRNTSAANEPVQINIATKMVDERPKEPIPINIVCKNPEEPRTINVPIPVIFPTQRADFSCQVRPSCVMLPSPPPPPPPPCVQRPHTYDPSPCVPAPPPCNPNPCVQRPLPYDCANPHSPLCPICARASCRYPRPCSSILNQLPPSKYSYSPCQHPPVQIPDLSNLNFCRIKAAKSEILPKSNDLTNKLNETAVLDKLLEDKINKILRPLILSLAKRYSDEEEREIPYKYSCGSVLSSKASRECFYPRRSISPSCMNDDYCSYKASESIKRTCSPLSNYSCSSRSYYPCDTTRTRPRSPILKTSVPDSYDSFKQDLDYFKKDLKCKKFPDRKYKEPIVITGGNMMPVNDPDHTSKRKKSKKSSRDFNFDVGQRPCSSRTSCSKQNSNDMKKTSNSSSEESVDLNRRIASEKSSTDKIDETDGVDLNKRLDRLFGS